MVTMDKLVSNAHYCNCNEHKKIYFHTRQHPKLNIYKLFTGIWLEKRHININKINIKTFYLRFQCFWIVYWIKNFTCNWIDRWNFCQPTCRWQLHAWLQNKTEHIAELTTVNTSWTTEFITSLIGQQNSALKLTYPNT